MILLLQRYLTFFYFIATYLHTTLYSEGAAGPVSSPGVKIFLDRAGQAGTRTGQCGHTGRPPPNSRIAGPRWITTEIKYKLEL